MNGTQDLNKWYTMEVYQMNKIQMPTSRESWYESTRVCESVVPTRNVNMLKALKITPMERKCKIQTNDTLPGVYQMSGPNANVTKVVVRKYRVQVQLYTNVVNSKYYNA